MCNPQLILLLLVAASCAVSATFPFGVPLRSVRPLFWPQQTQIRKEHLLEAIRHLVLAGNLREDEVLQKAFLKSQPWWWKPPAQRLSHAPFIMIPPVKLYGPKSKNAIPSAVPRPRGKTGKPGKVAKVDITSLPAKSQHKIKQVVDELARNLQKASKGGSAVISPKVAQKMIVHAIAKVDKIVHDEPDSDLREKMYTEAPPVMDSREVDYVDLPERRASPIRKQKKQESSSEESGSHESHEWHESHESHESGESGESESEESDESGESGRGSLKTLMGQLSSSLNQLMGALNKVAKKGKKGQ
ncbi:hypothetical protein RP20_CCG023070 [Aedes albopictus]|nr:hypothetical protein RP20_CCG023070 [Aedes albopictus]